MPEIRKRPLAEEISFLADEREKMFSGMPKLTNADRIRAMSDEELADMLYEADSRPFSIDLAAWSNWLQQPADHFREVTKMIEEDA